MDALEIVDKIKNLLRSERARVVKIVRTLDEPRQLTGQELSELTAKLVSENDPAKAQTLSVEISSGFYGK